MERLEKEKAAKHGERTRTFARLRYKMRWMVPQDRSIVVPNNAKKHPPSRVKTLRELAFRAFFKNAIK